MVTPDWGYVLVYFIFTQKTLKFGISPKAVEIKPMIIRNSP